LGEVGMNGLGGGFSEGFDEGLRHHSIVRAANLEFGILG
jgi:hypothetical protein